MTTNKASIMPATPERQISRLGMNMPSTLLIQHLQLPSSASPNYSICRAHSSECRAHSHILCSAWPVLVGILRDSSMPSAIKKNGFHVHALGRLQRNMTTRRRIPTSSHFNSWTNQLSNRRLSNIQIYSRDKLTETRQWLSTSHQPQRRCTQRSPKIQQT